MATSPNPKPLSCPEAALAYVKSGLRVIPIRPNSKAPLTVNGCKDATADPAVVTEWWAQWPDAGVALCPDDTYYVVDIDGDVGEASWAALQQHPDIGVAPPTLEQQTCHNKLGVSRQLFFRKPDPGVKLMGRADFGKPLGQHHLDARVTGGYVLAPPTVLHGQCRDAKGVEVAKCQGGNHGYNWNITGVGTMTTWLPLGLARLLGAAVADGHVTAAGPHAAFAACTDGSDWTGTGTTTGIEHRLEAFVAALAPAIQGEAGLATARGAAVALCRGWDLPRHVVAELLEPYRLRCQPPWQPEEFEREVIRNAHRGIEAINGRREQGKSRFGKANYGPDPDYIGRPAPSASTTGAAPADQEPAGGEDAQVIELHKRALADLQPLLRSAKPKRAVADYLWESAASLEGATFPPTNWLVTGLLTAGAFLVIGGQAKVAKSWVSMELAVAIATGTKAFGEFEVEGGPQPVAMFFAEDDRRSVRNRFRALAQARGLGLKDLGNIRSVYRGRLDLMNEDDLAFIVASCRRMPKPPVYLGLDPLIELHQMDEKDNTAMGAVAHNIKALRDVLPCAPGLVHHSIKDSGGTAGRRAGQKLRGGAIHGALDAGFYMEEDGEPDKDDQGRLILRATVDTELKAARPAGSFALELVITDDKNGEAVDARWGFSRAGGDHKKHSGKDREEKVEKVVLKVLMDAHREEGRGTTRPMSVRTITEDAHTRFDAVAQALKVLQEKGQAMQIPGPGNNTRWVYKPPEVSKAPAPAGPTVAAAKQAA